MCSCLLGRRRYGISYHRRREHQCLFPPNETSSFSRYSRKAVRAIASKPNRTKRIDGNRPQASRRTQPSRKSWPPFDGLDRSDGRFGQIFQGNFIHTRSLRLHGEQRAGNRLKNHRAAGSIGLGHSVAGIRPGFCAEPTRMLSYRHSGALARE